ncbi:hypothetical protein CASFOL_024108 [Castilleja foliolosa]|uniref:Uncharacterized protein n=1 Tax=Castilleja foliolosa TaxID=1961234 RepID=A0ABD3CNK3_9LAMI
MWRRRRAFTSKPPQTNCPLIIPLFPILFFSPEQEMLILSQTHLEITLEISHLVLLKASI